MKLGILIPLKAKQVARNWSITCACLEQTLRSIEAQTSPEWEAIVVGHDKPDFLDSGRFKTQFSGLGTSPPTPPPHAYRKVDWDWIRARAVDRNSKIIRGMQLLRDKGIDYWYYLDGDDLLHKRFVETLMSMDLQAGATLHEGYLWYPRNRRVIPYSNMPIICGSTVVIRSSDVEVPETLELSEWRKVPFCSYNHREIARYFEEEHNGKYVPVAERLLAYSVGHGDNTSDGFRDTPIKRLKAWAKPYILGRKIDQSFIRDFSLS